MLFYGSFSKCMTSIIKKKMSEHVKNTHNRFFYPFGVGHLMLKHTIKLLLSYKPSRTSLVKTFNKVN